METNLALVLGLGSGFAFLNIVLVLIWFLWERSRRKRREQQQDILTYINQRPRKLTKRNRPSAPTNAYTLPEKCEEHPRDRDMSPKYSTYFPYPSCTPRASPPQHKEIRHLGLSSLRNELYPASVKRKTSTSSDDTASMYSTTSAPRHLHEKLLSETRQSYSTVDALDVLDVFEKYDHGGLDENRVIMPQGPYGPSSDTARARYRSKYPNETSVSTPFQHQSPSPPWPTFSQAPRQICSVRPLYPKSSLAPLPAAARRFPSSSSQSDLPSRLRSPYSP